MRSEHVAVCLLGAGLCGQDDAWVERKLATIPAGLALATTSAGPDGSQHTTRTRFAFGWGGRFVAYDAHRGGKRVALVGERVLGEFDYLHAPAMDPTGTHYVFRAGNRSGKDKEQWWAVVDGERGKTFDWIGEVAVGANGDAAFWEQPGAKVRQDGAYNQGSMVFHFGKHLSRKFGATLALMPPSLSADGLTVATIAMRAGRCMPLIADTKQDTLGKQGFTYAEDVVLSPNGKRVAVCCVEGGMPLPPGMPPPPGVKAGTWRISLDGDVYGDRTDGCGSPVFSPDSKHLAFKFAAGARMGIAIDNEELHDGVHAFVGNPVFEANGAAVLYVSCDGGKIDDHARLRPWGEQSIQGGSFALHRRVRRGRAETLAQEAEGIAHLVCDPSGKIAYARKDAGKWSIVVGDKRSPPCDEVGPPVFAADGKKVAFGARSDRELWWRVLLLD